MSDDETTPATPDAGDASEPLSEDERAAVYFEVCPDLTHTLADGHDRCEEQAERLIAIVASREAAAATRARAEALREAADDFAVVPHPYEGGVTAWLRDRADFLTPDAPARTIPTTASVRDGLAADTAADNKVRWNRALKGGA